MASFPQNMHDSIKRENSAGRPTSRKGMKKQTRKTANSRLLTRETEIRPTGGGVFLKEFDSVRSSLASIQSEDKKSFRGYI